MDLEKYGIDFEKGGSAHYNPANEKLVVSLPRHEMDFFEVIADRIAHTHRQWSLVEKISHGIDEVRFKLSPALPSGPPVVLPRSVPMAPASGPFDSGAPLGAGFGGPFDEAAPDLDPFGAPP